MPSVDQSVREKYIRAGAIAREAREYGASRVKAGGSSLALADEIEELIRKRGGRCAFPVNIGVNEVAAHYTPSRDNDLIFRQGDVVKIDVGAHIGGYPADTAVTVEVGTKNYTSLIQSTRDALSMCVEMVAPGTTVSAIGAMVSRTVSSAGFRPVENLTGHSMEQFNLHAGLSIPNIETRDRTPLKEGMVLAIEPFASTGAGRVSGKGRGAIYRIARERRASSEITGFFSKISSAFGPFPFAGRWCDGLDPNAQPLLQKMFRLGILMNYPVLTDTAAGIVAQTEHSVLVTSDGCELLT
jgi:methionyl aminopeptidase